MGARNSIKSERLLPQAQSFHVIQPTHPFTQVDEDIFQLAVMFQKDLMGFPANTGFFVAAKRSAGGQVVIGVDPHASRADGTGYFKGRINVLCKDGTAKTVFTGICKVNHFVKGLEFLDDNNRSKDFFLADAAVVGMADKDGWFHKKALIAAIFSVAFAACHKLCPFFHADFDVVQDLFLLGTVNLGAQLGVRVRRVPDPDMFKVSFRWLTNSSKMPSWTKRREPAQQT